MSGSTIARLASRCLVPLRPSAGARVAKPTTQFKVSLPIRHYAAAAAATTTRAKRLTATTTTKRKAATGTKKTAAPKKKAAAPKKKVGAPKKKAAPKKEKKLKPWQARGADGKLLPLPSATKPTRRSAFLIFVGDRFQDVRSQPGHMRKNKDGEDKVDLPSVAKTLGQEWKTMSDSEKAPYESRAEKEKEAYEVALQKWRASLTAEDIRRQNAYITHQKKLAGPGERRVGRGGARLRDPSKPKGPLSPFMEFMADFRKSPEAEGVPILEVTKKAGAQWRALSPGEKEPFELRSKGGREQYQRDLQDWKERSASV